MNRKTIYFITLLLIIAGFSGCSDAPDVVDDFSKESYSLLDQDSVDVKFPEMIKGKPAIVGYIFTNCPDICPLTTNNMRLIKEEAEKEGLANVEYVSISFDPRNDSPAVLKKYAEYRDILSDNWHFLSGEKSAIDALMKRIGIVYVPSDSTILPSGEVIYYYVHTDRISLYDSDGRIRKHYPGSTINIDEIIADLKTIY